MMGLDIYLFKTDNLKKKIELESNYRKFSESLWNVKPYDEIDDVERDEIRLQTQEYAVSIGLDKDGDYPVENIEINSTLYPEHLFKIGYFRSSYNSSGINKLLDTYLDSSLYDLMGAKNGEEKIINWKDARDNILTSKQILLDIYTKNNNKMYRVEFVRAVPFNSLGGADSASSAMALFQRRLDDSLDASLDDSKGKNTWGLSYSDSVGHFHLGEPLQVSGMICSTDNGLYYGGFWMIYELTEFEWYVQAMDIMAETCNYVLQQPDYENYYMYFSG